jgi:UDP-2,3-diacylglucosamine pyrophosphatase LpxH
MQSNYKNYWSRFCDKLLWIMVGCTEWCSWIGKLLWLIEGDKFCCKERVYKWERGLVHAATANDCNAWLGWAANRPVFPWKQSFGGDDTVIDLDGGLTNEEQKKSFYVGFRQLTTRMYRRLQAYCTTRNLRRSNLHHQVSSTSQYASEPRSERSNYWARNDR